MNNRLNFRHWGFSLVELSIATAVLSMGLGGLSLMMMLAVHGTSDARYRTLATSEVSSLAELILMNRDSFEHFIDPAPLMYEDCSQAEHCSDGERASGMVNSWRVRVQGELPAGDGLVCRDSTPDDGSTGNPACDNAGDPVIKVFWNNGNDADEQAENTQRVVSRLSRP